MSNFLILIDKMDNVNVIEDEIVDQEHGEIIGVCKWFNKKLGYGFITVLENDKKGHNVFVHHSGIKPLNSQFRTLRKGEYVHFDLDHGKNGLQAMNVTGILGGPLMCDNMIQRKYVRTDTQINNVSTPILSPTRTEETQQTSTENFKKN